MLNRTPNSAPFFCNFKVSFSCISHSKIIRTISTKTNMSMRIYKTGKQATSFCIIIPNFFHLFIQLRHFFRISASCTYQLYNTKYDSYHQNNDNNSKNSKSDLLFFFFSFPLFLIIVIIVVVMMAAAAHTVLVIVVMMVVMLFFLVLVWVLGIPGITSAVQWLPIIGTTIGTWGLFRARGLALRLCMLSSTVCWLVHNIWAGSWGGILLEGSFFIVNGHIILGLYRARRRGRCTSTPQL